MAALSDKIVAIKNESSPFRHKDVRLKMDEALTSLKALSSKDVTKAEGLAQGMIDPAEWISHGILSSIATLKSFREPPPPPPARSLLALASSKLRLSTANVTADHDIEGDDEDDEEEEEDPNNFPVNSLLGAAGKKMGLMKNTTSSNIPEESQHSTTTSSTNNNHQQPIMSPTQISNLLHDKDGTRSKLTKEVVVIIDALCGTILKSPTYHSQKMCELALDCITILITNGYIYGKVGNAASGAAGEAMESDDQYGSGDEFKNSTMTTTRKDDEADGLVSSTEVLELLIETICKCSDMPWEVVQGAMTKALLAMVISSRCAVHEAALLKIVRSIFHVYLVTKSTDVKALAKSSLLDIVGAVYNRMEAYDAMVRSEGTATEEYNSAKGTPQDQKEQMLSDVLAKVDQDGENKEEFDLSEAGSTITGANANEEEKEDADVLGAVAILRKAQSNNGGQDDTAAAFASQFHTDGYLLFRALCKLSSKSLPEDHMEGSLYLRNFGSGGITDPLAFQTKLLSLELLVHVFDHSDTVFTTGERFIYAIRYYLCVSLLKNCMSLHTNVGHSALKIFLVLVYKFKSHLKAEIEVFVANIFLRVLESRSTSLEQKALVLEALRALCVDPHLITSIFLNYDCDFDAIDLYKNIVLSLTKLSQGKMRARTGSKKEIQQEQELAITGLEVLVVILRAMLKLLDLPGGIEQEDTAKNVLLKSLMQLDIGVAALPAPRAIIKSKSSIIENKATDDSEGSGSGMAALEKAVGILDRKRTAQQNFESGCVAFTQSIRKGIQILVKHEFVSYDAKEIAQFLLDNQEKLDKTQIGDLLGREADFALLKDEKDPEMGGPGFSVMVLHHYVNSLDFAGILFDDAIRGFLSGFRLPGEAQKIDRIMEKFAERYSYQNEDVFPSADTAFILAFSVIMLNTDLHNPSIKDENRMTMEGFMRNNRGIAMNGDNLPKDFLEGIYNRIKAEPFALKEDDAAREAIMPLDSTLSYFFGNVDEKRREEMRKEKENMMDHSYQLFKERSRNSVTASAKQKNPQSFADTISPSEAVVPMFDATWGPLLATLSSCLEKNDDPRILALCLNGFVYAIRIAANCNVVLVRDTFVGSLTKFTTLGSIKEMKNKHIECIRVLLSIAVMDGEVLNESWGPIIQCISQVARLQHVANGVAEDGDFLVDKDSVYEDDTETPVDTSSPFFQQTYEQNKRSSNLLSDREEANARAVLEAVNETLIDKVFASTVNLSARGILHFIEQMIAASISEISGESMKGIIGVSHRGSNKDTGSKGGLSSIVPAIMKKVRPNRDGSPRVYCLQKLVEVADYNMDVRPRLVWTQIWEMMAAHFADVCSGQNAMLSMFAVDSLRQLSFKFLGKPELNDFNFQRIFLRPFEQIMKNPNSRADIRELVLRCVDNMIRSLSDNLRSGWKVFFAILKKSSSDASVNISKLGLAILQRILDEHMDVLCHRYGSADVDGGMERKRQNADAEDFVSLCNASLSFVPTSHVETPLPIGLSMRALCHTACYADLIASKKILPPASLCQSVDPSGSGFTYGGLPDGEAEEMVLWRPILDGLAAGIASTVQSNSAGVGNLVQRGSAMTLRAILLRHKDAFSTDQWFTILSEVILPALGDAARTDHTHVVELTSDSPAVSQLHFVTGSLDIPPSDKDESLVQFAREAQAQESAPLRPFGTAELLVEATFANLRHGGDGNIGRKGRVDGDDNEEEPSDHPFPDSWIATTAGVALGMVIDIVSEVILKLGSEGRTRLWPIISEHFQHWIVGYRMSDMNKIYDDDSVDENNDEMSGLTHSDDGEDPWQPCEALVRISSKELCRLAHCLAKVEPALSEVEMREWWRTLSASISSILKLNVDMQETIRSSMVKCKLYALKQRQREYATPYGLGSLVQNRQPSDSDSITANGYAVKVIKLSWGATLYEPILEEEEDIFRLDRFIPPLKVKAAAAYTLQFELSNTPLSDAIVNYIGEEECISLLDSLNASRELAHKSRDDEDLAHAFQEFKRSEWGDSIEEIEKFLSETKGYPLGCQRGGSGVYYLAQESSTMHALLHFLSLLLFAPNPQDSSWKRKDFAESMLLERMNEVLVNFIESEQKDGHLVNPNVWKDPSASGGQIALYCTSFSSVVVLALEIILKFDTVLFQTYKKKLFPLICSLISARSDDIRSLVSDVMRMQVGPLIDC